MTTKIKIISAVLWLLVVVSPATAGCGSDTHYGMTPVFTFQDTYENGSWGYAVQIPKGYKGASFSDPGANQHGINIVLSPKSEIYINGEANSLEDESTGEPLDSIGHSINNLNRIRQNAAEIKSYELRKAKLGKLSGTFYIVHYTCPEAADVFIEEGIIAVSPDKSLLYDITLQTTAKRYQKHHSIFKRIAAKWRQIPRK